MDININLNSLPEIYKTNNMINSSYNPNYKHTCKFFNNYNIDKLISSLKQQNNNTNLFINSYYRQDNKYNTIENGNNINYEQCYLNNHKLNMKDTNNVTLSNNVSSYIINKKSDSNSFLKNISNNKFKLNDLTISFSNNNVKPIKNSFDLIENKYLKSINVKRPFKHKKDIANICYYENKEIKVSTIILIFIYYKQEKIK